MTKYPKNTCVVVNSNAVYHAGETGYVEFYGTEGNEGLIILRKQEHADASAKQLFVVDVRECQSVMTANIIQLIANHSDDFTNKQKTDIANYLGFGEEYDNQGQMLFYTGFDAEYKNIE